MSVKYSFILCLTLLDVISSGNDSTGELRIVLLGKTGAGKSATGNTILGRDDAFKEGQTFESVTSSSSKKSGVVSGRKVLVVDTPGLFDTSKTEEDLKTEIEKCVNLSMPGPHMFLLVIRLGVKFTAEEEKVVKWIQDNFGKRALQFTMVLFTHADEQNGKPVQSDLPSSLRTLIDSCGGGHHAFDNAVRDDQTQVTELMEKIDAVVRRNGEYYTNWMYQKAQRKIREEEERKRQEEERKQQEEDENIREDERRDIYFKEKLKEIVCPMVLPLTLTYIGWPTTTTGEILHELRIVLVGKSGAGKSATGNTILRSKAFTEDPSFESVTNSSSNYSGMVFGRKVLVVDTPGLYDTSKTEEDVKTEIEKCVNLSMPGPHVFLLVIRLGVRFTAEEENAVKWIQEHFGKRASQFTILLFTHVDQLNGKKPKDIFNKKINDLIKSCDDRYHAFDNRDRKDKTQVEKLLQKIDFLVNEINDKEHYTNGMYQEAQRKMEEEKEKMRQEEEKRRKEHEEEMQKQKREREERIRKEERERSIKKQKEKEEEEQKQGKRRWVCSVIGGGVGAGLGAFISVFTASPVGLAIGATTGSNLADHLCYWAA